MYFRLWGVTFMSDCEVTLRPSGVSLDWALNVRLVFFVCVRQEKPHLDFPFSSPCIWRRRRGPGFRPPRPIGAWMQRTSIYYVFISV